MTPTSIRHAEAPVHTSTALRIAHITATFPPYLGGTGAVAYHNAVQLARRGNQVHVCTVADEISPDQAPPGVTVHRMRARFAFGNAPFAPGLVKELERFDILHLHYPFYFGAEQVWWMSRQRRIPYVITYHQDVILRGPLSLVDRIHHRLVGLRILADAQFVAATSMDYATHSRLAALVGSRLVEVPNGVDIERFHPLTGGDPLRPRYGLGQETPVVLFVATLDKPHYFKGLDVLLTAMSSLPDANLLVIGDGDQRPTFERAVRGSALSSRVRFLGHISEAELPAHFALADVVTVPSTTRGEAFGLVAVEAMASGKIVVASRLPGVRTVVDDGTTGYLAEPGNAVDLAAKLRLALSNPQVAQQMGRAGRRKVEERYDWRRIAAHLEGLYHEVLR